VPPHRRRQYVERLAHELKGCLGSFAAQRGFAAAEKLENLGRTGRLSDARVAAGLVEAEVDQLTAGLERWQKGGPPSLRRSYGTGLSVR
jgi:HPt (histidine-containing phosphotransfer) domain-containing protein